MMYIQNPSQRSQVAVSIPSEMEPDYILGPDHGHLIISLHATWLTEETKGAQEGKQNGSGDLHIFIWFCILIRFYI